MSNPLLQDWAGPHGLPPFADILSQEAIWAIRTYIESEADKDPAIAAKIN